MNFIITPLRWIIDLLYSWGGSYSIAIILFTLVVKLILLPLLILFAFCQRFFVESIERVGIVG